MDEDLYSAIMEKTIVEKLRDVDLLDSKSANMFIQSANDDILAHFERLTAVLGLARTEEYFDLLYRKAIFDRDIKWNSDA